MVGILIVAVVATILLILGRMNETGHGSRLADLREFLTVWRAAKSRGERLLMLGWYLRALCRLGYYGASVAVVSSLALAVGAVFGFSWDIARQTLCSVLRFLERLLLKGAREVCTEAT